MLLCYYFLQDDLKALTYLKKHQHFKQKMSAMQVSKHMVKGRYHVTTNSVCLPAMHCLAMP